MQRFPNRFGGMRDLAFFSRDMRSRFDLKSGAGCRNHSYERERDFVFLWGWDAGIARGTERDMGF